MNKGDIVRKKDLSKRGGLVKYICCINSTRIGNGQCDKKICMCIVKDYAFVQWSQAFGGGTSSLPLVELELDIAPQPGQVGIADQMIDAEPSQDTSPDNSLFEKEKELAAQYDEIKATTPYDAKWFDSYNYRLPETKQWKRKDLV